MKLGKWQLDSVRGGDFSMDGGAVYGVVPKTVWEKVTPCDEINRVRLRNNCVLARIGHQTILIDTGYGGKYPPLDRKAYAMEEGNPILESLASRGMTAEDIDAVVFSHLHFDHAGGATFYDEGCLVPTFPNAKYVVSRLEWEDATAATPELLPAYPQDNLSPLRESSCLHLVDDGATVVPGLTAIRTGGHTRGHLALLFESGTEAALYIGDICPTIEHVRQLWCLAYDTFQLITRRQKRRLLEQAAANDWWVMWTHDPSVAISRVATHLRREFEILDPRPEL